jgi:ubiquinone/menaquinone biosynthesis C-methylase UbiE
MPSLEWNFSVWDKAYPWSKDGDEWDDFARACGVEYSYWKASLAEHFLIRNIKPDSVVLEIGPGHGRWSSMIPSRVPKGQLHLIDLSESCIAYCKKRLVDHPNVQYHVNDGLRMPMIQDASIDFLFSIDTFVHIEETEVRSYAREFKRVLKPQSMGVIHHAGNPTDEQRRNGMRSLVGLRKFTAILAEAGLYVIRSTSEWGGGCTMHLTGDAITTFARP